MFLGGLGPLTPKNNGWCCDRDEGGVLDREEGSVYRWLGVPYTFHSIAFSLTRADINAGNSLSVPQYTAIPLSYIDACFFCLFAVYWK